MAQTINRGSEAGEEKVAVAKETAKKTAAADKKAVQDIIEERRAERKAARRKGALGYRIGAVVLWLLAIACEILAIMALLKDFVIQFTHNGNTNMVITLILFIVLDLIFAIIAAQLWKKANHIDPPSEENKFTFYLISELGVIMACICFIPLIIVLLKNDKLDKKSKTIVTIVAIAALLITGFASADYNPISEQELDKAENVFEGTTIYWTPFGHKYHLDSDCQSIVNSATYVEGDVTEAVESGRTSLCFFCARNHPELAEVLNELNVEGDVADILENYDIDELVPDNVTP